MTAEDAGNIRARRERDFFAEWGLNPAGDRLRWRRELDLLRRARPGGLGSVLSLGCGRGWFETQLAEHADHVLGIDLSPESIKDAEDLAASRGITNIEFICEDVNRFELDRSFDTVVCVAFLHHLSDRECLELLARIHRHLRQGGLLHTQDPNVHGLLRKLGRIVLGSRYDKFHSDDERELDPAAVRQIFLDAGFKSVDLRYMDLCLIPAMQLFPKAPAWTMQSFALLDRAWCSLPVARWASGFAVDAIR
jgi:SAM-dependent methyltransferase